MLLPLYVYVMLCVIVREAMGFWGRTSLQAAMRKEESGHRKSVHGEHNTWTTPDTEQVLVNVTVVHSVWSWARRVQYLQTFYGSLCSRSREQSMSYWPILLHAQHCVLGTGMEIGQHLLLHLSISVAMLTHRHKALLRNWQPGCGLMQPRGGSENPMRSVDIQCLRQRGSWNGSYPQLRWTAFSSLLMAHDKASHFHGP